MSVRLESFQYLPRGADGWVSRLLHFGDMFTTVQGPNGSGKTPILKGVMQGLGHEVDLPPDVLKRCESAQVTLTVDGRPVVLTRRLGPDFNIIVADGEDIQTYTSESKYAERFHALLNVEAPRLTTKLSLRLLWLPSRPKGPAQIGFRLSQGCHGPCWFMSLTFS